jgi:hypothetical protein
MDHMFRTMLTTLEQSQAVDLTVIDSAIRKRSKRVHDNIDSLTVLWGSLTEVEVQAQADSGEVAGLVATYCGEVQAGLVGLALYCRKILEGSSAAGCSILDDLVIAHHRGVQGSRRTRVAVQARQLMSSNSALRNALHHDPVYVRLHPTQWQTIAQKVLLVLEVMQKRLSSYTKACGADVVDATMRLATPVLAAGGMAPSR